MTRQVLSVLVVTLLVAGAGPAVQAGLINVDANDDHTGGDRLTDVTYAGAAVLGQAGDTWNSNTGGNWGLTDVLDADGNGTSVDVQLSGFKSSWSYKSTANGNMPSVDDGMGGRDYVYEALFGDYAYVHNATGTVTLSDLDSGTSYELVVYAHGDANDQNGIVEITTGSVGGGDPTVQSSGVWTGVHDLTEGLDYVQWDSVTPDASGTIAFTFTNDESEWGGLAGLQITPEPATLALLGLGGLGLMLRRKRK